MGLLGWLRRMFDQNPIPPPGADMLGAATLVKEKTPSLTQGGEHVSNSYKLPHVVIPPVPMVTPDLLLALDWVEGRAYANALAAPLRLYGIHDRTRLAAFLAQVGHESGGGRFRREIWGPTEVQARYEGRRDLGNTEPGDGARFRGRGLIQITGRANTTAAHQALRPDLTLKDFCAWLEGIEGASISACWWWAAHGCNELADAGDFERLTRRINGGINGLADRRERWAKAKAAMG